MVKSDLSHRVVVEPTTAFGSVGVNFADQEIVVLAVR
jgi:hypothetical protein